MHSDQDQRALRCQEPFKGIRGYNPASSLPLRCLFGRHETISVELHLLWTPLQGFEPRLGDK